MRYGFSTHLLILSVRNSFGWSPKVLFGQDELASSSSGSGSLNDCAGCLIVNKENIFLGPLGKSHGELEMGSQTASAKEKLTALRKLLTEYGVDAYYVPSEDPHMSEYPAAADERRAYISGFTGSAGFALVSQQGAWLWTDGRYHLQAEEELDAEIWTLMKAGTPDCPKLTEFIPQRSEIKRFGVDPFLISKVSMDNFKKTLAKENVEIIPIHKGFGSEKATDLDVLEDIAKGQLNLVDIVWESLDKTGRPKYSTERLTIMPDSLAGATPVEKITQLRETMSKNNCSVFIAAALDEIAWLYNLRGRDSKDNRVFLSYAIVTATDAYLYLKEFDSKHRLTSDVQGHLKANHIVVKSYDVAVEDLKQFIGTGSKVLIPNNINYAVATVANISSKEQAVFMDSPILKMKSIKNSIEIKGMKQAHIADGVALAFFFTWLQSLPNEQLELLDEFKLSRELLEFRKAMRGFVSASFETIAGVDSNGAIVHYRPLEHKSAQINPDGMLLLDSGGHYESGTTDVTRTVHLGVPSRWERELFTRVLMGHIDVADAVFPPKVKSGYLDVLARRYLWEIGLNYAHGTGHGVGHSICVHEMPPTMSYNFEGAEFETGMVISDEPGVYLEGQFGIRIESVLLTKRTSTPVHFNNQTFLGFEQLTLFPYCRRLIQKDLLSQRQLAYLNTYHTNVFVKLAAEINLLPEIINGVTRPDVLRWLREQCLPI